MPPNWSEELMLSRGGGEGQPTKEPLITESTNFYPTLFVGESSMAGLYALPALVDEKTIMIAPKYLGPPLLEGPVPVDPNAIPPAAGGGAYEGGQRGQSVRSLPVLPSNTEFYGSTYRTVDGEYLLLGYHEPPPDANAHHQLILNQPLSLMDQLVLQQQPLQRQLPFIEYRKESKPTKRTNRYNEGAGSTVGGSGSGKRILTTDPNRSGRRHYGGGSSSEEEYYEEELLGEEEDEWTLDFILLQVWRRYPLSVMGTVIAIVALLITVVYLTGRQNGLLAERNNRRSTDETLTSGGGGSSRGSRRSDTAGKGGESSGGWSLFANSGDTTNAYHMNDEYDDGLVQVGKLQYNPKKILGRGCEGTVVFKGQFDGREVAVKRIVSDFIELVEREVDHLRASDSHSNVIRYFCSESDKTFRYIALELCECNLEDYVKNKQIQEGYNTDALEILRQASDGIAHLHNIKIVHRDIKPKNVLMVSKGASGGVRVLISDFGLCKKIKVGHNSISKMSGVAGTEGWMAPEVMLMDESVTCAVDVFSLGCIFYYVLTGGHHPFGEPLRRQENILRGEYTLDRLASHHTSPPQPNQPPPLTSADYTALQLIEAMLQLQASRRPLATAVAMHPIFWSQERQLQFLMEVSDRIEKEDEQSLPMLRLEWNNVLVVGRSWKRELSGPLQEDLLKFRAYKYQSVRDLLRAIRNKKHHYRELSEELRESLGEIPGPFLTYFTSKFPRLFIHIYTAMTVCANENSFLPYYPADLKAFYERVLAEELEKGSPRHTGRYVAPPPGFSASPQPLCNVTVTGAGVQPAAGVHLLKHPHFQSAGNLVEKLPKMPYHHSPAEEVSDWRRRSKSPAPPPSASIIDTSVPPPPQLPTPSPTTLIPTRSATRPSKSSAKKKAAKKKKRVPFSALADLNMDEDVLNEEAPSDELLPAPAEGDAVIINITEQEGLITPPTGSSAEAEQ